MLSCLDFSLIIIQLCRIISQKKLKTVLVFISCSIKVRLPIRDRRQRDNFVSRVVFVASRLSRFGKRTFMQE